jgi:hypothetical protein
MITFLIYWSHELVRHQNEKKCVYKIEMMSPFYRHC